MASKLLKFSTPGCIPCKMLNNYIQDVADALDLDLVAYSSDSDANSFAQYGVRSAPTLIRIDEDGDVERVIVGLKSKEQLIKDLYVQ